MSKVTSKLQVTLPRALARRYRIKPGDEILWVAAGDSIRVLPAGILPRASTPAERLKAFDRATERQRQREECSRPQTNEQRDWRREELYQRGRSG